MAMTKKERAAKVAKLRAGTKALNKTTKRQETATKLRRRKTANSGITSNSGMKAEDQPVGWALKKSGKTSGTAAKPKAKRTSGGQSGRSGPSNPKGGSGAKGTGGRSGKAKRKRYPTGGKI